MLVAIVILLIAVAIQGRLAPIINGPAVKAMSDQSIIAPHKANRSAYRSDEERVQQILAATWRVIGRDGISAASLRTIAAELGATTGLVTRYFPEKQGLLLAALERATSFLSREVETASAPHTGVARLQAVIPAALPVTSEKFQAWQVWIAFMGELPGSPDLGKVHAMFPDRMRRTLVKALREAQLAGRIAPETHIPHLADMLLNQIIGAGVRGINEPGRYPAEKLPEQIAPFFTRIMEKPN
jgi:AcrR family transcriptional regulator